MLNGNGKPFGWAKKYMKDFLAIDRIDDDVIVLADGTLMALLKIEPIDFPKLSAKKKEEVLSHYRTWINSLDHSVQIVSRSVNMDFLGRLKILLNRIEHDIKKNPEKKDLLQLFRDFAEWVNNTMKDHPNRLFFVVIPYTPPSRNIVTKISQMITQENDLPEQLESLNKRVASSVALLSKTGVKISRMNTNNINELLLSYFVLSMQNGTRNNLKFDIPTRWFDQFKQAIAEVE